MGKGSLERGAGEPGERRGGELFFTCNLFVVLESFIIYYFLFKNKHFKTLNTF